MATFFMLFTVFLTCGIQFAVINSGILSQKSAWIYDKYINCRQHRRNVCLVQEQQMTIQACEGQCYLAPGMCQSFIFMKDSSTCVFSNLTVVSSLNGMNSLKTLDEIVFFQLPIPKVSSFFYRRLHTTLSRQEKYRKYEDGDTLETCANRCLKNIDFQCTGFVYSSSSQACSIADVHGQHITIDNDIRMSPEVFETSNLNNYYEFKRNVWMYNVTMPPGYSPRYVATPGYPYQSFSSGTFYLSLLTSSITGQLYLNFTWLYVEHDVCNNSKEGIFIYDGTKINHLLLRICEQHSGPFDYVISGSGYLFLWVNASNTAVQFISSYKIEGESFPTEISNTNNEADWRRNTQACAEDTCQFSGTCINLPDDFICICNTYFTGRTCESVLYPECHGDLCKHLPCRGIPEQCQISFKDSTSSSSSCPLYSCMNGTCLVLVGNNLCECPSTSIECFTQDPCSTITCTHGECLYENHDAVCVCEHGYIGDSCEEAINLCQLHPCMYGNCSVNNGLRLCECYGGYTGEDCDTDVNECVDENVCNGSSCINVLGGYRCVCADCQYGLCLNDQGVQKCLCFPGFVGENCTENVNDCAGKPCIHGNCTDYIDAYRCNCEDGYTGYNCELSNTGACAKNPCKCGACLPVENGFRCECLSGEECDDSLNEQPMMNILLLNKSSSQTDIFAEQFCRRYCSDEIDKLCMNISINVLLSDANSSIALSTNRYVLSSLVLSSFEAKFVPFTGHYHQDNFQESGSNQIPAKHHVPTDAATPRQLDKLHRKQGVNISDLSLKSEVQWRKQTRYRLENLFQTNGYRASLIPTTQLYESRVQDKRFLKFKNLKSISPISNLFMSESRSAMAYEKVDLHQGHQLMERHVVGLTIFSEVSRKILFVSIDDSKRSRKSDYIDIESADFFYYEHNHNDNSVERKNVYRITHNSLLNDWNRYLQYHTLSFIEECESYKLKTNTCHILLSVVEQVQNLSCVQNTRNHFYNKTFISQIHCSKRTSIPSSAGNVDNCGDLTQNKCMDETCVCDDLCLNVNCDVPVDDCRNDCHHGTCQSIDGKKLMCVCSEGFAGRSCNESLQGNLLELSSSGAGNPKENITTAVDQHLQSTTLTEMSFIKSTTECINCNDVLMTTMVSDTDDISYMTWVIVGSICLLAVLLLSLTLCMRFRDRKTRGELIFDRLQEPGPEFSPRLLNARDIHDQFRRRNYLTPTAADALGHQQRSRSFSSGSYMSRLDNQDQRMRPVISMPSSNTLSDISRDISSGSVASTSQDTFIRYSTPCNQDRQTLQESSRQALDIHTVLRYALSTRTDSTSSSSCISHHGESQQILGASVGKSDV